MMFPVLLGVTTATSALSAGFEAQRKGEGIVGISVAEAKGGAKGAITTVDPDFSTRYDGRQTVADKFLRSLGNASQTTAIGAGLAAAAGVEAGPFDVPILATAGGAMAVNVLTSVAQAGLKVTGLAGADAEDGYVYDGIAGTYDMAAAGVMKAGQLVGLVSGGETVAQHKVPDSAAVSAQQHPHSNGKKA
jgi:hypothetical protein